MTESYVELDANALEAAAVLAEPNTKMAIRLADRLIAEGFQEPDEDTAVLSLAVIQLSDVIRNLAGTRTEKKRNQ